MNKFKSFAFFMTTASKLIPRRWRPGEIAVPTKAGIGKKAFRPKSNPPFEISKETSSALRWGGFISIFALIFWFFPASQALAADLEVTFENDPLFSQVADGYWYPGRSETRWVTVKNNSGGGKTVMTETFNEIATYSEDLADVLELTISSAGVDLYGGSLGTKYLADFYNESELSLVTLSAGQSVIYDFTVKMNEFIGNPWQGKDTSFDLKIGFYGVTPSPGAGSPPGTPVCTQTKPGIPTDFAVVIGPEAGQVTLWWTPPALPYTYFLIAYSDNSDWPPKWGNPNVGNVTSYLVSGLGGGTYWFWIRAGNGCMPGDFIGPVGSGEIVGIAGGSEATSSFVPIVLGEKTPGELGEAKATQAGEVTGAEIFPYSKKVLILAGFIAAGGSIFLYLRWLKRN